MDADARGARAGLEALGDARVVQVLDHAQLDRLSLILGKVRERRVETVEPGLAWPHKGRPLERLEDPEALARGLLQPAPADRRDEHVARDAEQPRRRRAARLVTEAASASRLRLRWNAYIRAA